MQVKVLAFGVLKDLLGTATAEIELLAGSSVATCSGFWSRVRLTSGCKRAFGKAWPSP